MNQTQKNSNIRQVLVSLKRPISLRDRGRFHKSLEKRGGGKDWGGSVQYLSLETALKQVLLFLEAFFKFSWCSKMSLNLVPAIKGTRFLKTSQISSACLWNPSNLLLHFWSLHWWTHWTRGLTLTSGNKLFTIVLKILFPV